VIVQSVLLVLAVLAEKVEMRNACIISVEAPEGRKLLWRLDGR